MTRSLDVLVIGAGPAGIAAALELRRRGVADLLVIDREAWVGGAPRILNHVGFGMRDLHTVLTGPAYARRYAGLARQAGIEVRLETTATAWVGPTTVTTTSPAGLEQIEARAIVLATGCRERPRSARLVPGTRPLGVTTTGALSHFVTLFGQPIGHHAVVVGAEHVSFSAALSLAESGARGAILVTEHPVDQTYSWLRAAVAARSGCRVLTSTRVTDIVGHKHVEGVEVEYLPTGRRRVIACDTVVFSGDWVPEHEFARLADIEIDAGTRGPAIDLAQRTSARGVFAAGNMLHAAQMGDQAALDGRLVAGSVSEYLATARWPETAAIEVRCQAPVRWISPNRIEVGAQAPRSKFVLRVDEVLDHPRLEIVQDGRLLWSKRFRQLRPALPLYADGSWVARIIPRGGAVTVRVA